MATKLENSDEDFLLYLHMKILKHCSGKNLADVASFVGALALGTLHYAADNTHVDIKTFLLDFADRLRETIEETLKDSSLKPKNNE